MIWIIASMPFWIIGTGFFTIGLVGIYATVQKADTSTDGEFKRNVYSILAVLVVAGGWFLLAAKICS